MLHAVFIGVNHYKDPNIPDLKFARADAERFANLIEMRLEPDERRVHRFLDEDATLENVRVALGEELPSAVEKGDLAIIYFACHGSREQIDTPDKNGAYLALHDTKFDRVFATGIDMACEIPRLLRRLRRARLTVLILDACFSGYIGGRTFRGPGWPKTTRGDSLVSLKDIDVGERCMVLAAAGDWQLAREDEKRGHGLFTYHLLNALNTLSTNSPTMSGAALYAEVAASVKRETSGTQVPVLSGKFAAAELPLLGVHNVGHNIDNYPETSKFVLTGKVRAVPISGAQMDTDTRSGSLQPAHATKTSVQLPEEAMDLKIALRRYEAELILLALNMTRGNQVQAARLLNIPLRTLAYKIKTLGIRRMGYSAAASTSGESTPSAQALSLLGIKRLGYSADTSSRGESTSNNQTLSRRIAVAVPDEASPAQTINVDINLIQTS